MSRALREANVSADGLYQFGKAKEGRRNASGRVGLSWVGERGRGREERKTHDPNVRSTFPLERWETRKRSEMSVEG